VVSTPNDPGWQEFSLCGPNGNPDPVVIKTLLNLGVEVAAATVSHQTTIQISAWSRTLISKKSGT